MMELLATCAIFRPAICNVAVQAGQTGAADTFKALIVPTVFIIVLVVALVLVIHYVKETMKRNPVADLDREFRAEKDTLLILADAKKREREKLAKEAELQETDGGQIGVKIKSSGGFMYLDHLMVTVVSGIIVHNHGGNGIRAKLAQARDEDSP